MSFAISSVLEKGFIEVVRGYVFRLLLLLLL